MKVWASIHALLFATTRLASASTGTGESAEDLIAKGDIYYDRLQPAEALKYYLPAEKLDPANASLLVKIARQYRHMASECSSKDDKLRLGSTAIQYSRRAVALQPKDSETHLALAISLGKVLPFQGNKDRIEASREIKEHAERVIQLDPQNDLAWHVLGRWNMNLAEVGPIMRTLAQVVYGKLPDASNEDAVKDFQKAIQLNPSRLMHYIELGCTFAQMGRKDDARKYITKGLAMRNTEKDDPQTKARGREVLAKLQ